MDGWQKDGGWHDSVGNGGRDISTSNEILSMIVTDHIAHPPHRSSNRLQLQQIMNGMVIILPKDKCPLMVVVDLLRWDKLFKSSGGLS
ncbi:hypothetical protein PanWU01x14_200970 [Parasponia andersonii]|uniref:Uncharacterized protein n=1 Tax=Parasponia andersonii TaxID=3476 RepID=A0A2P5BY27_PARAD|nr:hypothetical protein PanWU01x14_200970 [Parasponia andersonii]